MGEMGGTCVQETGNGKRRNVYRAEEVKVKLRIFQRDGGTIISQAAHGKLTWMIRPPDEGGLMRKGRDLPYTFCSAPGQLSQ